MYRTSAVNRWRLAGAGAAITLTFAAACASGSGGMNDDSDPISTTATTFNDADVMFAQMMIPHHQQAVEMSALAEARANDPELKQMAAAIRSAQQPEIATMTGWLQSWGMPTAMASSGHDMPGMMSEHELAELEEASGVEFDRRFASMMIDHHNGAIEMSDDVTANGSNPDVKALAATIERTQAAEVAQLQAILDRL